jgi:hypothetical protein
MFAGLIAVIILFAICAVAAVICTVFANYITEVDDDEGNN